jgi:hypothetical protein
MSYAYPNVTNPLGTTGQRGKWQKHSVVSTGYETQSVLDNATSSYYASVVNLTIEKATFRRKDNSITYTPSAGSRLGWLYSYAIPQYELDTLKVVGFSYTTATHLYLSDSRIYVPTRCHFCGIPC